MSRLAVIIVVAVGLAFASVGCGGNGDYDSSFVKQYHEIYAGFEAEDCWLDYGKDHWSEAEFVDRLYRFTKWNETAAVEEMAKACL